MIRCALTTVDNPFDPFNEFLDWYLFDMEKGYNSCSILARLTTERDDMTMEEEAADTENAINRLIEADPLNLYVKVKRDVN